MPLMPFKRFDKIINKLKPYILNYLSFTILFGLNLLTFSYAISQDLIHTILGENDYEYLSGHITSNDDGRIFAFSTMRDIDLDRHQIITVYNLMDGELNRLGDEFICSVFFPIGVNSETTLQLSEDGQIIVLQNQNQIISFEYVDNNWRKHGEIEIILEDNESLFSYSFSKDGKTLVVSTVKDVGSSGQNTSRITTYNFFNDKWNKLSDEFFLSGVRSVIKPELSFDGKTLALFHVYGSILPEFDHRVLTYKFENQKWVKIGTSINFYATFDHFNLNIPVQIEFASNGTKLFIGSLGSEFGNDTNTPLVNAYEFQNEDWVQKGESISSSDLNDGFGHTIRVSKDGNRILIASPVSIVDNNINSGAIRVYEFANKQWHKLGQNIYGEDRHDFLGFFADISGDGSTVFAASINNSTNGLRAGKLRIYNIENLTSTGNKIIKSVSIYPNPSSDYIHIANRKPHVTFKILNQLGIEALNGVYDAEIDIRHLSKGIYFIQIEDKSQLYIGKFIKK